jgi:hypothetical protein
MKDLASTSQECCSFLRCWKFWRGPEWRNREASKHVECSVMAAREEERSFSFLYALLQNYSMYIYKVYSGFPRQLCKQGHLPQTESIKELKCLKVRFPLLYYMYFDLICKEMYMVCMKIFRMWYWSENKLLVLLIFLPSEFLYMSVMFCFQ